MAAIEAWAASSPPALPGRQQQFDRSGSPSEKLQNVSRQAHEKEKPDGRVPEFKPYEVGLQIPRSIHSEMPATPPNIFRSVKSPRRPRTARMRSAKPKS